MNVLRKVLWPLGLAILPGLSAGAENSDIILDLTQAQPPLEFNADTGAWTGTYDDDAEAIESQCFMFLHNSISDWYTWWGFTASNSADNSFRTNFITYQFSNMAEGGIQLTEDGEVMKDEFDAPVVNSAVPYIVGYYSPYMSARPVDILFNTGKAYKAKSVYLNLNSYTCYSVLNGDGFARAFANGDSFKVIIHGVGTSGQEKTLDVELASYENGNLNINRGWRYVDLSELGVVTELYFTISTTDVGAYGANTPQYFCLDKLMVEETGEVVEVTPIRSNAKMPIRYDGRSGNVWIPENEFAALYDANGNLIMTSGEEIFNIGHISKGVFIIRSGNNSLKIIR